MKKLLLLVLLIPNLMMAETTSVWGDLAYGKNSH